MKTLINLLLVIILFSLISCNPSNGNTEMMNRIVNNLGKKIIIDKDTTTIIDYNTITYKYQLSNGTEINIGLGIKLIDKDSIN